MKIKNKSDVEKVTKPRDIYELMKAVYAQNDEIDKEREQLYLVGLDVRKNIKTIDLISMGTINESLVSVREIYRTALTRNCYSIILVHNHPSGNPTPSHEDIAVTKKVKEAGELVGVVFLDHVIYTDEDYTSMREAGLVN